ncbi:hypothetical protein PHMEG_00026829 [Phytophthora megakarya]|uniref:Uncharacterized protein n=1 Tax=Phytophthora megakarya TaxID=4795 RepID=A0A225V7I0_9STRA|nr:hypothetical protein PHMEG_00026829 [Phytophthora megakarya]
MDSTLDLFLNNACRLGSLMLLQRIWDSSEVYMNSATTTVCGGCTSIFQWVDKTYDTFYNSPCNGQSCTVISQWQNGWSLWVPGGPWFILLVVLEHPDALMFWNG